MFCLFLRVLLLVDHSFSCNDLPYRRIHQGEPSLCFGQTVMGLILFASWVCMLQLRDLLVVKRNRRTTMTFFADEVVFDRRLVTTKALHTLEIHDLVASCPDLGALLREVQVKKFPAVGLGKFLARVLDHGFVRQKLKKRANRIFPVRPAILENSHRLFKLFRIGMFDVSVSNFGPVENATERVFSHCDILGIQGGRYGESQRNEDKAAFAHQTGFP